MAKLSRESRLRERRQDKQAKKDAKKLIPAEHADPPGDTVDSNDREVMPPGAGQPAPATVVQALADA